MFLISGVTGAGKSTILDTICLALFNAVPRLGTGRSADRFNGISSRDYKQLLRTGAKEGYAELSFRGNNNREYVARWRVWLTAKKINSQWTLIPDGDAAKALVKEKLIESEISAALNIDYEQFVRTSLLAQGEFTRFLNSDDAEKAKILARLTGVGVLPRWGAKYTGYMPINFLPSRRFATSRRWCSYSPKSRLPLSRPRKTVLPYRSSSSRQNTCD